MPKNDLNIATALAIANREIYRMLLSDFNILDATKKFISMYPQYSDIELEILMMSLRIFKKRREGKDRVIEDGAN